MPTTNIVQKDGRVRYIEPNLLRQGDVQNGITQPYENYSFSVNLRVYNGNRYDCGNARQNGGSSADNYLEYSSNNSTLSFMDGTTNGGQSYLTTNFTDISMSDPAGNTKECLGISDIRISYQSWFYPTVSIRFIDVRGASLMLPAEQNYYNRGNALANIGKEVPVANSKFFSAFFSFPYPLFKLSVKGFYGREVTYDLSVNTCNIEFNSSTGNFEISTEFIGYMYGMYTDLPFQFVYVAPYINSLGIEHWNEKKKEQDFTYLTFDDAREEGIGREMCTLPELKTLVYDVGAEVKKTIENSALGKLLSQSKKLRSVLKTDVMPFFPTSSSHYTWKSWSKNDGAGEKPGYFFILANNSKEVNRSFLNDIYTFSDGLEKYNKTIAEFETISEDETVKVDKEAIYDVNFPKKQTIKAKSFYESIYKSGKNIEKKAAEKPSDNDNKKEEKAYEFTDNEVEKMLSGKIVSLSFTKSEKEIKPKGPTGLTGNTKIEKVYSLDFNEKKSNFGDANSADFMDLVEMIKKQFDENSPKALIRKSSANQEWIIRAYKLDTLKYKDIFNETLEKIEIEITKMEQDTEERKAIGIREGLGFDPTMKNLFSMLFAHIDTFMHVFYTVLQNINNKIQGDDQTRLFQNFCSRGRGIEVDVNDNLLKTDNVISHGKLPPFTMFYKVQSEKNSSTRKSTAIWPGLLPGGNNLDEVKFVESLLNATSLEIDPKGASVEKENKPKIEGPLVPTNYYDILQYAINNENVSNPYLDVLTFKTVSDPDIFKNVMDVFLLRCFYALLNGGFLSGKESILSLTENALGLLKKSISQQSIVEKAKLIGELEAGNVIRAFKNIFSLPSTDFLKELHSKNTTGDITIKNRTGQDNRMFSEKKFGKSQFLMYDYISQTSRNSSGLTGTTGTTISSKYIPVGTFKKAILKNFIKGTKIVQEKYADKFLKIDKNGTALHDEYTFYLFKGGKAIQDSIEKYTSKEYADATRLFKNYKKLPESISNIGIAKYPSENESLSKKFNLSDTDISTWYDSVLGTPSKDLTDLYISVPSFRITDAGPVSIFMDPLYYAQKTQAARAYMFLMGIPYGKDKKFFLPTDAENGDYPSLMLLRAGAVEWRATFDAAEDPITYTYTLSGVQKDVRDEVEKNDPCFGVKYFYDYMDKTANGFTKGRTETLKNYFLRWAGAAEKIIISGSTSGSPSYEEVIGLSDEDLKDIDLTFKEIENNLALNVNYSYKDGDDVDIFVPMILQPESCDLILKKERADSFSNDYALKANYITDKDGKLGTIKEKDVLRRDVFLKQRTDITLSEKAKAFFKKFYKLYLGFDSTIDFGAFDVKDHSKVLKTTSGNMAVYKPAICEAVNSFVKLLKKTFKIDNEYRLIEENEAKSNYNDDNDTKLACYIALKSMYDRWLCSRGKEAWEYSSKKEAMDKKKKSDFRRFIYMDEFFHNNGMEIRPNLSEFIEEIPKMGQFSPGAKTENITSTNILKVMSYTAKLAGCSLLTLPTMLGLQTTGNDNQNSIQDVFTAFPFNESVKTNDIETTFIVLYSSQKSQILNNNDDSGRNAYKSDGFDIANTWGKINPLPMFSQTDGNDNDFVVPCFGVTFGKQNQAYFKDVRLAMNNHQVTEYALKNTLLISQQANHGPSETTFVGQDLYPVYSNYSYDCNVTMMGDAQITPLMYFQLNNIPMWKGAYLITTVTHTISVNGMQTEFTGVRQARPSLPYKDDKMMFVKNKTASKDSGETVGEEGDPTDLSQRQLGAIDVNNVNSIIFVLDRMPYDSETDTIINGSLTVNVYKNDGMIVTYNDVADTKEISDQIIGDVIRIENFNINNVSEEGKFFVLPNGKYSNLLIMEPLTPPSYLNMEDKFHGDSKIAGKRIVIGDPVLGTRNRSEFILGSSKQKYEDYVYKDIQEITVGNYAPIAIFNPGSVEDKMKYDENESIALCKDIFSLIQRSIEARKPITLLIQDAR